jgi:hypothetical protein
LNNVVLANVSQRPEERVAVPGNGHVAGISRKGGSLDVPQSKMQRAVVGSLEDDNGQVQAWNLELPDRGAADGRMSPGWEIGSRSRS